MGNYGSPDNYSTLFLNNIVQKRGGGRRPPPLFWERPKAATIFLSKYCLKIVPGVLFDNILTIFGPLGEYFLSTFRGPSKIIGFQYFDNFRTICPGPLRDGPKSSKINILTIFQHFRKYLSVAVCRNIILGCLKRYESKRLCNTGLPKFT